VAAVVTPGAPLSAASAISGISLALDRVVSARAGRGRVAALAGRPVRRPGGGSAARRGRGPRAGRGPPARGGLGRGPGGGLVRLVGVPAVRRVALAAALPATAVVGGDAGQVR